MEFFLTLTPPAEWLEWGLVGLTGLLIGLLTLQARGHADRGSGFKWHLSYNLLQIILFARLCYLRIATDGARKAGLSEENPELTRWLSGTPALTILILAFLVVAALQLGEKHRLYASDRDYRRLQDYLARREIALTELPDLLEQVLAQPTALASPGAGPDLSPVQTLTTPKKEVIDE